MIKAVRDNFQLYLEEYFTNKINTNGFVYFFTGSRYCKCSEVISVIYDKYSYRVKFKVDEQFLSSLQSVAYCNGNLFDKDDDFTACIKIPSGHGEIRYYNYEEEITEDQYFNSLYRIQDCLNKLKTATGFDCNGKELKPGVKVGYCESGSKIEYGEVAFVDGNTTYIKGVNHKFRTKGGKVTVM